MKMASITTTIALNYIRLFLSFLLTKSNTHGNVRVDSSQTAKCAGHFRPSTINQFPFTISKIDENNVGH